MSIFIDSSKNKIYPLSSVVKEIKETHSTTTGNRESFYYIPTSVEIAAITAIITLSSTKEEHIMFDNEVIAKGDNRVYIINSTDKVYITWESQRIKVLIQNESGVAIGLKGNITYSEGEEIQLSGDLYVTGAIVIGG